jgi:YebC/PmpR family DNA-binding regulatory protein
MAGHSHWAGIKHKKAAVDARKGKLYSKLAKKIIVAVRQGGPDPTMNIALKYAIDKAKAANMPKDNIERTIKRASGELGATDFEEIVYEGYGPGGVAILMEILTDNRNRTAGEIRKLFDLKGGSLGKEGSVAWMFDKKGLIAVRADQVDEDEIMEIVLEAGAEDIQMEEGLYEITTDPSSFETVKQALMDRDLELEAAELAMASKADVEPDPGDAKKVVQLVRSLEDHDDIQNVYTNYDIPDDLFGEA